MRLFTGMKRIGAVLLMGLAVLNFAAYRQARAFTHFAPPGHRTPRPQMLSLGQKMQVLVKGVELPRPARLVTWVSSSRGVCSEALAACHSKPGSCHRSMRAGP